MLPEEQTETVDRAVDHGFLFLVSNPYAYDAGALRQLQTVRSQQQLGMFSSPNQEIALLSKKWRTERNLWYGSWENTGWQAFESI